MTTTEPVTVRLPAPLVAAIESMARSEGSTRSEWLRTLIAAEAGRRWGAGPDRHEPAAEQQAAA